MRSLLRAGRQRDPLPEEISFVQAVAPAANGPLALEQLTTAETRPGLAVLVPGASGLLGTLLVALAHRMGARVIAVTRGRRAAESLIGLGRRSALTPRTTTSGCGRRRSPAWVDVVVDNVAAKTLWKRYCRPWLAARASCSPAGPPARALRSRWTSSTSIGAGWRSPA